MSSLAIVAASTRPGRAGLPIAQWFSGVAQADERFNSSLVDLAEIALPFLDEPEHPARGQYTHDHTKRWSKIVAAADCLVFVTPENNYGYPASLKNAIDFLHKQWQYKPVGFVSYGGVAAGTRSVQQLKQVVTALKMVPLFEAVNIPFHPQFFDDEGGFVPSEITSHAAQGMLDELNRVETGLRQLRG
jgi:NAD(P)H-dependent FMN reductase